ncbi:hypothetical protein [Zhongshania sp.]|uniref:hypothetical protein n=1 Tax=Zhongshania sp. TaxID=1971902 RepID=UPI003568A78E
MTEANSNSELKEYFVQAGFVDSTELMADICDIPDRVFVMHNSYALVVGYAALPEENEADSLLMEAKERMHAFIRKALLVLENQKGLIVDGYLLIALHQAPRAEVKEVVRDIELDTKICRKHVVWPVENGDGLERLQFVTILSLPDPLRGNSANATSFELSVEAKKLLAKYDELGSLERLLDAIKNGELADAN